VKQKLLFILLVFLAYSSCYLFCNQESPDINKDIFTQEEIEKKEMAGPPFVGLKSYTRNIEKIAMNKLIPGDCAKQDLKKTPEKTKRSFALTAGISAGVVALYLACNSFISGGGGCCGGACSGCH